MLLTFSAIVVYSLHKSISSKQLTMHLFITQTVYFCPQSLDVFFAQKLFLVFSINITHFHLFTLQIIVDSLESFVVKYCTVFSL